MKHVILLLSICLSSQLIFSQNCGMATAINTNGAWQTLSDDQFDGIESWYQMTPPSDGYMEICLQGASYFIYDNCVGGNPNNQIFGAPTPIPDCDGGFDPNGALVPVFLNDVIYIRIQAGVVGSTIQVRFVPITGNACDGAIPVNCNQTYLGNTAQGSNNLNIDDYGACNVPNDNYNGNELVYLVDVPSGETLRVSLLDLTDDVDLIIGSCIDGQFSCIANSSNLGTAEEQVQIPDAHGAYYIVVDGWTAGIVSSFILTIECVDAEPCVSCGECYNYHYVADNGIQFNSNFYNCDNGQNPADLADFWYEWSLEGTVLDSGNGMYDPQFQAPTTPGTYEICMTVRNCGSCADLYTCCQDIVIGGACTDPVMAYFEVIPSGPGAIFNDMSMGQADYRAWYVDGNYVDDMAQYSECCTNSGYEICLVVGNECGMSRHCIDMDCWLDEPLVNDVGFDYSNGSSSNEVDFSLNGQLPGTYEWDFGDGSANHTGCCPPTHTYPNPGQYLVCLIYTPPGECGTICIYKTILVEDCPQVDPYDCQDFIDYQYVGDGTDLTYVFQNLSPDITPVQWTAVVSGGTNPTVLGSGNTATAVFLQPGQYTVCFEYIGPDGCPYICCREICVANPFGWDNIVVNSLPGSNSLDFTFDYLGGDAEIAEWRLLDQQGELISSASGGSWSYSFGASQYGFSYLVCFRYYDGFCWRLCYRWICIEPPFGWGNIVVNSFPSDSGIGYNFNYNGTDAQVAEWAIYDESGAQVDGATGGSWNYNFNPSQYGFSYLICFRYYDGFCWRVCYRWICIDPPFGWSNIVVNSFPTDNGLGYDFNYTGSDAEIAEWAIYNEDGEFLEGATGGSWNYNFNPSQYGFSYLICFRYYDGFCWRVCYRWICIDPPFGWSNIVVNSFPTDNGLGYDFNYTGSDAEIAEWAIYNEDGEFLEGATGGSWNYNFNPSQYGFSYLICFRYYDGFCWRVCYRWICIDPPFGWSNIVVNSFPTDNGLGYDFNYTGSDAEIAEWAIYDENGEFLEGATGGSWNYNFNPSQYGFSYLICFRYYDGFCWRVCYRWICIDPPFGWSNIVVNSFPTNNGLGYDFNYTGSDAEIAEWAIYDENGDFLEGSTGGSWNYNFNPSQYGFSYLICFRYYDGFCWRVCYRWICIQPPFGWEDIQIYPTPTPNGLQYDFNYLGTDVEIAEWRIISESGAVVATGGGTLYSYTFTPSQYGQRYLVCYRYYDGFCWQACYRWVCVYDPYECDIIGIDQLGTSLEYQFAASGGVQVVEWYIPELNVALTGDSPTYDFGNQPQGVYTICLLYYDPASDCYIWCCRQFPICDVEPPYAFFEYTLDGNTIAFDNQSENGDSYLWDFGNGQTSTSESPDPVTFADGSYTICLEVINECDTAIYCIDIVICNETFPNALFGYTVSGSTIYLHNYSEGAVSYEWDFDNDGTVDSNEEAPTYTYPAGGNYTVCLTVYNDCGLTDTYCIMCMVEDDCDNNYPLAYFLVQVNGSTVSFTNQSQNAVLYNWDFGDGTGSTDANPTKQYDAPGFYLVCLNVANPCGMSTFCVVIEVVDNCLLTPPSCNFEENIMGTDVSFINASTGDPDEYFWEFGDGNTSMMSDPTHAYPAAGRYLVSLQVRNDCDQSRLIKTLALATLCDDDSAEPSFTVDGIDSTTVMLTNTSVNVDSLEWDMGDGTTLSSDPGSYTYNEPGLYTVCLTGWNECGIAVVFCLDVAVVLDGSVIIDVDDAEGAPGDTVLIPVRLFGCESLSSIQGTVEFEDISILNILGVDPYAITQLGWNPDLYTFSFFDLSGQPQMINSGDTLFHIVAELVGEEGDSTAVEVVNGFTSIEVLCDGDFFNPLDYTTDDGIVRIRNKGNITGIVKTEDDIGIYGVNVNLYEEFNYSQTWMTDSSGLYEFLELRQANYTVKPFKDTIPNNGLSTAGLFIGQRHILGIELIESPYRIIAMDANCNDATSTADLFLIQRVILGLDEEFANCPSWVFVPEEHMFSDQYNPFPYPDSVYLPNLAEDVIVNFIGIKVGDILGNANPYRNNGFLELTVNDQDYAVGDLVELTFTSPDFIDIGALQFGLQFNEYELEFQELIPGDLPGLGQSNFALNQVEDGQIRASWFDLTGMAQSLQATDEIFTLRFVAKRPITDILEVINLDDRVLPGEAFTLDQQLLRLILTPRSVTSTGERTADEFVLLQNRPNPFADGTIIEFRLPESAQATFTVHNVLGEVVYSSRDKYNAGWNRLILDQLYLESGMYIYTIETDRHRASKTMVVARK